MRKIIKQSAVLLLGGLIYLFAVSGFKEGGAFSGISSLQDAPGAKSFLNMIFNNDYYGNQPSGNTNYQKSIEYNLQNIKDTLKFNGVQVYGLSSNLGGTLADSFSSYEPYVSGLMNTIGSNGMKGYWGRNLIEFYTTAQRINYEAEGENYGFSYQNHTGVVQQDSGRTVVHMRAGTDSPGWLCSDIYENLQHGDMNGFNQNDVGDWYIKPVVRMKQSDFNINDTNRVLRIQIKNYEGDIIDNKIIRVRNFITTDTSYNGAYIYKFDFQFDPGMNLITSGSRTNGINKGMSDNGYDWIEWKANCKTSFDVYWYGNVDVWLDKVTVDDAKANLLFDGALVNRQAILDRIEEEASAFTQSSGMTSFFTDEVLYSQVPCIKYIDSLLKAYSGGAAKMHLAQSNFHNARAYRDSSINYSAVLNEVKPESFNVDAHTIEMLYLPNTLDINDFDTDFRNHYNTNRFKTPEEFNENLQLRSFGDKSEATGRTTNAAYWKAQEIGSNFDLPTPFGTSVYNFEKARRQSTQYSPDTKFIAQPQLQSVFGEYIDGGNTYYSGNREPLNEEIQAQAMLAIAHGADGLCWYVFQSYGGALSDKSNPNDYRVVYGLLNTDNTPRTYNLYGQDKWHYISEMNQKILNWKPTLDNINWLEGYSIHSEGSTHNFISDVRSLYRNSSLQYINDDAVKYWEMGFFNPIDANDKSKYFIMVNRRCIPETSAGKGDYRKLQIKFNDENLRDFSEWKIIDVNTNQELITVSSNSGQYYDIGEFKPGEGKLYKIIPVR